MALNTVSLQCIGFYFLLHTSFLHAYAPIGNGCVSQSWGRNHRSLLSYPDSYSVKLFPVNLEKRFSIRTMQSTKLLWTRIGRCRRNRSHHDVSSSLQAPKTLNPPSVSLPVMARTKIKQKEEAFASLLFAAVAILHTREVLTSRMA